MPAELNVALDLRNLARFRRLMIASRALAAKSLTFTAERAQTAWRAGHSVFHKRRTWIDKGVRIKHATAGGLVARVGTIDKYMGRHVEGVDDAKRASGKGLFVPVQPIEQQPTHTGIRSKLRAMQRTKAKPFWRNGTLLRRPVRGKGKGLTVLAVMRKSVDIKPRLDALEIVDVTVQREFPLVYERLFAKWIETGQG